VFVCGFTFGFGLHHFHWVGSVVADVNTTRQSKHQNDTQFPTFIVQ